MKLGTYTGRGERRIEEKAAPVPYKPGSARPEDYFAEPGLVDAVNVALLLERPLLLTGEPGTGKTELAKSLAWELGLGAPLAFATKSDSKARDLFYYYDALARFQARESGAGAAVVSYLTYNACGAAILLTREPSEVADCLTPGFEHGGRRRSVVLIDEVDKAPRDFPNDLLNELEQMSFRIPELGNREIVADPELRPVVVITSNSEKDLPDAFLRRCVFYHIPFPDRETLADIVARRLGLHAGGSSELLDAALGLFFELRHPRSALLKKPATAELLDWLVALRKVAAEDGEPLADVGKVRATLCSLVKTAKDQDRAAQIVERWIEARQSSDTAG